MSSLAPHVILLQLPLLQAGQLLLVVGCSFALITLIASTSRFHKMVQLGEESLTTIEDCNDFFFIQVTRYLSKINRVSSSFAVFVVQFQTPNDNQRVAQESLLAELKKIIREECDKACLFRDDCVAAIIDTEEENIERVTHRMTQNLLQITKKLPSISAFRAGASSFPLNGVNTQIIIDQATNAMELAKFEDAFPFQLAAPPEVEEEKVAESDSGAELSREDKNAALDPLTGVLKPEAVGSYMRKYLAELRRKKNPATLICIGVNRIDNISGLHGDIAADAVIAGVSKIIKELSRSCDLIGRYHRDDFVILSLSSLKQGEMVALRIRDAVQKATFTSEGKSIKTSVSIGISSHPEHGRTLQDLFRKAYTALEIVRGWNTSSCLVYDPTQHEHKANYERKS